MHAAGIMSDILYRADVLDPYIANSRMPCYKLHELGITGVKLEALYNGWCSGVEGISATIVLLALLKGLELGIVAPYDVQRLTEGGKLAGDTTPVMLLEMVKQERPLFGCWSNLNPKPGGHLAEEA